MKTKKQTPIKAEDIVKAEYVNEPQKETPQELKDEQACANEIMEILKKYNCTIVSNTAIAKLKNESN